MRVLIVGCGYVGQPLAIRHCIRGDQVWGIRRSPPANNLSERDGFSWLRANISIPVTLRELPRDLDRVYFLVSPGLRVGENLALHGLEIGCQNLVNALRDQRQSPDRLVFVSTTGVYPDSAGQWLDERAAVGPIRQSAQALLLGEKVASKSPFRTITVRFSGIYGPGRTHLLDRVRQGQAGLETEQPIWTNRIHRDDCAAVLIHLADHSDPAPLYIGTDSCPVIRRNLLDWIAREMHSVTPTSLPAADRVPVRGKRLSNAAVIRSGYRFIFPSYIEGYRSLLETRSTSSPSLR